MGLIDKLIGTYSERQIKKLQKTADAVEALAEKYKAMSNEELSGTTALLKKRLEDGETLDDILPDAFAAVREADDRVLGKRPFRVQILGGIILHQGRIAEMKTGEGKTLVATMPAYLNALMGKGVHIVTVNDYLARRDSEEMGRVYAFMGLSTGLVVHGQSGEEKKQAYLSDITYGTNNEFGFDYLRDNMALYKAQLSQRGHFFAIVDEVDSILIDEARTPLIISGDGEQSTDLYDRADAFVRKLRKFVIKELDDKKNNDDINADYIVDEKAHNAILTAEGIKKAEGFFGIENLADPENATISHHINQAIRAYGIMHRDVDYVVDGENGVVIVDAFTGRLMPGRRYSNGLHQAIEAKEKVKVQKENRTLATITFQNYFRMYTKLSGMTGTALTEDSEFREIYNLDVVEVPTNKPMIRLDRNDMIFTSVKSKQEAIVKQIKECHEKGQPVLVGTVSIDKSEELSALLKKEGVSHAVLNAKHHEKEAEIVAQAGKLGAVTISTNMAGRGTDIMLGGNPEYMAKVEMRRLEFDDEVIAMATGTADIDDESVREARRVYRELYEKYKKEIEPEAKKVREAGGLYILGTERHESRRIDNQLRGRAGRQGDPGESRFFISFEDDLMRLFGSEKVLSLVRGRKVFDDVSGDFKMISDFVENSQRRVEENNFKRRKNVITYDDVMNQQRNIIYKQRQSVLNGEDVSETIKKMISSTIEETVDSFMGGESPAEWNFDGLRNHYRGLLCNSDDFVYSEDELKKLDKRDVAELLKSRAFKIYEEKEKLVNAELFREAERAVLLHNVDLKWMDHIDAMDDLKDTIGLQAYAQRDPVREYRIAGADMFDEMINDIRESTVRTILTLSIDEGKEIKRSAVAKPVSEGFAKSRPKREGMKVVGTTYVREGEKVYRNDPCPCGSGKKYKKCCGANKGADQE